MSLLETFMQGFLNIPACKSDTGVSKCPCSTEPWCCYCGYTNHSLLQEWLLQNWAWPRLLSGKGLPAALSVCLKLPGKTGVFSPSSKSSQWLFPDHLSLPSCCSSRKLLLTHPEGAGGGAGGGENAAVQEGGTWAAEAQLEWEPAKGCSQWGFPCQQPGAEPSWGWYVSPLGSGVCRMSGWWEWLPEEQSWMPGLCSCLA